MLTLSKLLFIILATVVVLGSGGSVAACIAGITKTTHELVAYFDKRAPASVLYPRVTDPDFSAIRMRRTRSAKGGQPVAVQNPPGWIDLRH